ncbi:dihydroxyacetone kinase family protein [Rhizobium laguerreae]|uniref:DAK2 domain-containing protein n=1 Tax=Rhizobium laguerreae TaxID=1076926 RepID=A0AB35FDD6_9HYPH|nr:dihydroxyacetone kinase subunit L [Rhizobium laguerreae]MBY3064595.1 DAK2 domain-containing protein [Rhizobium laguerreae]MBY3134397.1 DAK2 domain-containing protein [Rhizobium laguerreae]MBY3157483.1 DAK2 domain-containing protein [Rhizobium laguerreae]MBY3163807.1 DAK2 domain-containing protein [Rhizobium laguerreae]MBY3169963.1 DAK2 domain-containing protein [Rhizobium laguerreae]
MNQISASDLIRLFDDWKALFAKERDFLISLDGKVGDSDLGITMSKAFAAAAETVAAEGEASGISKLLRSAGAIMARTAPSTMGTLTATGFLRASKALDGAASISTAEMATFWRAFRDGIAERGKAKVGDKTLLDVLDPVARALEEANAAGEPLGEALSAALAAAEGGLEDTKAMVAQHGKAAAFQEKTVGLQDAGATVGVLLISAMTEFVNG